MMLQRRHPSTYGSVAGAIKEYGTTTQCIAALRLFRDVSRTRGELNAIDYNAAISVCGKGRQWQHAVMLLREVYVAELEPSV
eukprot:8638858-Pyramimonas_sp.AAC.1